MAVDPHQRGREGTRRTSGNSGWLTTDLAVGGSNPSRRAKHAGQGLLSKESSVGRHLAVLVLDCY